MRTVDSSDGAANRRSLDWRPRSPIGEARAPGHAAARIPGGRTVATLDKPAGRLRVRFGTSPAHCNAASNRLCIARKPTDASDAQGSANSQERTFNICKETCPERGMGRKSVRTPIPGRNKPCGLRVGSTPTRRRIAPRCRARQAHLVRQPAPMPRPRRSLRQAASSVRLATIPRCWFSAPIVCYQTASVS